MTTYDFHAQFAFALQDSIVQGQAIQWLAGEAEQLPERWQAIQALTDPIERLTILAQAMLGTHSDRARSGTRQQSGGYRFWVERHALDFLHARRAWMQELGLEPNLPDLAFFPAASWALQIPFRLRKPYLSKDDTTFHLLDNPVRKEQIFQTPMVAATGWKGALRAAMVQQLVAWWSSLSDDEQRQRAARKAFVKRRVQLARLFGNEKGVQTDATSVEAFLDTSGGEQQARLYRRVIRRYCSSSGFFTGRLHFFATFFDKIGLEVINPHNRQSGVGERGPILLECVPQGATGTLLLLYAPAGTPDRHEVAQDLAVTAQGLHAMLTTYGFGAKTSSGFGVVEEQLAGQGKLLIRAALSTSTNEQTERPIEPQLPAAVQSFRMKYPAEDFSLKPQQWRKERKATNRDQDQYKEARAAFLEYQQQQEIYQHQVAAWNKAMASAPRPQSPITERMFTTLSGLQEQAQQVAAQLRSGGEG
jgi:CRISPR-associated protein Cmr2